MGLGCGDMRNFGAKIVNYNHLAQKGPKRAFLGRKMGVEAGGGDTVEECMKKKVPGYAPGPVVTFLGAYGPLCGL